MRLAFLEKGIKEETIEILLSSCAESTKKQYESSLNKWLTYCRDKKCNPLLANINIILSFFTDLFKKGLGYSSLNTVRSALSLILPSVDGYQCGSHPLLTRFLKAIGKLRPPVRRYNTVWDAGQLLNYFTSLSCNEELSLKHLTMKTAALLAILSGQRVQTLSLISLLDIKIQNGTINILVSENVKTSRPGAAQPNIVLPSYGENVKLCPVTTLLYYIDKTKGIRRDCNQLFISYEPPYKSVSVQTISRWLKSCLQLAGIDISIFKSHSYRHASTSKAYEAGVNVDVIFASAGWNNNSRVFARFYKCKIDSRDTYAEQILKS